MLDGGYRAYRRHLRELFEQGPRVIIVGGRTGVGKTRVLRALAAKNHQVLDLEALAAHRGSAFGDLKGAAQPSNAARAAQKKKNGFSSLQAEEKTLLSGCASWQNTN